MNLRSTMWTRSPAHLHKIDHTAQGFISLIIFFITIFPSQFKYDEKQFCCHPNSTELITTNLCTCHNSCPVMAHATICSDIIIRNGLHWHEFSIKFQLWWKRCLWNVYQGLNGLYLCEGHAQPSPSARELHLSHTTHQVAVDRCVSARKT